MPAGFDGEEGSILVVLEDLSVPEATRRTMLARVTVLHESGAAEPPFAAEAEWTRSAKRALRQKLRALRQALPPAAATARSARIIESLLRHPRVQGANAVALFWPMLDRKEVDLRSLDHELRERGVDLYYPFMSRHGDGDTATGFRRAEQVEDLRLRGRGFVEPATGAHVADRGEVDVVIVPALAATPTGHRLGYGAGFYDATLPDLCPPGFSIVVVFDFQLMLELPLEPHDIACSAVITDREAFDTSSH